MTGDIALVEQLVTDLQTVIAERDRLRRRQERLEADLLDRTAEVARQRGLTDSLLASAGEGIYGTDRDGNITFMNPAMERLIGYSAAEALGKNGHALIHHTRADGTLYPLAECPLQRAQREGRVHSGDDELLWRKNGSPLLVHYASAPLVNRGTIVGSVTLFEDITERKRIERLFSEFIEGSSDLLVRLDAEGRFTYFNPSAEQLFCQPAEPCLGQFFLKVVHPPDDQRSVAFFEMIKAERTPSSTFENRVLSTSGEVRDVLWVVNQHFDASGQLQSFTSIGRDITERKRMEASLEESEARLTTLINALPDIVCFKDGQGRWLLANEADLRLFRLQGVDYRGKTDAELAAFSPFYREAFLGCVDTDEQAWQGGDISKAEEVVPQPEAPPVILETFKIPLFNPDGSRKGLVVIGRDVTERKRMEEERLRYQLQQEKARAELAAAKQLDRLKTTFVNAISHDLRTPLTSIKGYAEFLEDDLAGTLTPGQRAYVAQIARNTKRLELMVNDLLDFARMEAGTFTLNLAEEDLRATIAEVVESLRPIVEEADLCLEVSLPAEPLRIRMDAPRIERVVTNLLTNAIKFTPAGGRIALRAFREQDVLVGEVEDSGIGIAPQDLPRLFQRFSQLEAGVRKGGTGLGLSIIKAFVEAHGGTVTVSSEPGCGTTFRFTLPVDAPA